MKTKRISIILLALVFTFIISCSACSNKTQETTITTPVDAMNDSEKLVYESLLDAINKYEFGSPNNVRLIEIRTWSGNFNKTGYVFIKIMGSCVAYLTK